VFITGRAARKGAGPRRSRRSGGRSDSGAWQSDCECDIDCIYDGHQQKAFGRLPTSVLPTRAGGSMPAARRDITEEPYEDTFAANVKGVIFTVAKKNGACPAKRRRSVILQMGSTAVSPARSASAIYGAFQGSEVRNLARRLDSSNPPRIAANPCQTCQARGTRGKTPGLVGWPVPDAAQPA